MIRCIEVERDLVTGVLGGDVGDYYRRIAAVISTTNKRGDEYERDYGGHCVSLLGIARKAESHGIILGFICGPLIPLAPGRRFGKSRPWC
jgi:hypothetical protein